MLDLILALCLITMGFFIGTLSGFFGFGGGFILAPFLISLGFPASISVGTSVMEIFMSSLIASLKHKQLGNLEVKMGLTIAFSSIFGVELGAQIIEHLEGVSGQNMNLLVSLTYISILSSISTYMIYEGLNFKRKKNLEEDKSICCRIRRLKIPPYITMPQPGTTPISVWMVSAIGLISGLLAGFLGAGGGFILIPLLIYVIGCKPPVAAGTCIFAILLSCAYASLTHTLKGNIDFVLAILVFSGSLIGVQIGASATKYLKETKFKLALGLCLGSISLSVAVKLISNLFKILILEALSQLIIFLAVSIISLFIIVLSLRIRCFDSMKP